MIYVIIYNDALLIKIIQNMCDSESIFKSKIGYGEPDAVFWTDINCKGQQFELGLGEYQLPTATKYGVILQPNTIDGFWIPPNMKLTVTYSNNKIATYDGRLYADLSNPLIAAPKNSISKLKLERVKPWSKFLADCCAKNVKEGATPETCGNYWTTGTDNIGVCDSLMNDYCKVYPDSDQCTCYSIPSESGDTLDIKLLKANPPCWSDKCSKYGYIPSNLTGKSCPNVKVCKQQMNLPGSNNLLKDNSLIQDCSTDININPGNNGTPDLPDLPNSVDPDNNNNNISNDSQNNINSIFNSEQLIEGVDNKILFIILLIIAIIILYNTSSVNNIQKRQMNHMQYMYNNRYYQ